MAFFLVEMGDKAQLATVALAARYDSLVAVVMGTTLGMMIANVPAVWMGEALAHRVKMKAMRWVAAALFRRRAGRAHASRGRSHGGSGLESSQVLISSASGPEGGR